MSIQQGYQSEIEKSEHRGHPVIIKRARRRHVPLWRWVEAWLISREARALEILEDVQEVPLLLEKPDPWTLVMEFREGTPLSEVDLNDLPGSFFRQLEVVVDEIHDHGVVHSDLKKKDNLMVTEEDEPVLVDFGTAFVESSFWRPVNRFLYNQFHQIDQNAVSKLKSRYARSEFTEQDQRNLDQPVFLERVSRVGRNLAPWRS